MLVINKINVLGFINILETSKHQAQETSVFSKDRYASELQRFLGFPNYSVL
jgi:hypothetical protein